MKVDSDPTVIKHELTMCVRSVPEGRKEGEEH